MSQTLITVAALLSAPAFAAKGSKGMSGTGYSYRHSHRHPNEVICATFNSAGTKIDVVREDGEIFIQGPASFFADASNPFIELHVDLSAECQEGTIYKSIFITYNPGGHPPIDFFGGGYGVPHWDAHFFTIPVADTEAGGALDMTSCATTQVPIQCDTDSTDPRNVKFNTVPSAQFVPEGFKLDTQFGGNAIIDHGNHWLDETDTMPGGPAHHTINGAEPVAQPGPPSWVQCAMQQPAADGTQIDNGCRYGVWSGFSNIFNTFDGVVTGNELMFTTSLVDSMIASVFGGSVARVEREYPQSQQFQQSGMSAQQTFISVESNEGEADPLVRVGIVLGTSTGTSGGKGSGRTSSYASALTAAASSEAFAPVVAASAVGLVAVVALLGYRARRAAVGYETLDQGEYAETGSAPPML
jgi:hypothetical protein